MCGIAGFLAPSTMRREPVEAILARMTRAIAHRGPDDQGAWVDAEAGIALGHRRLSILDLSPAGHQPMISASGRFAIVFNGEIYNHLELRSRLPATSWRGHSDTETLLAAIDMWGMQTALKAAVGMFALALWDRQTRTVTLARDRLGEKPLYYGWQGEGRNAVFLFGSELKALRAHPAFAGVVDSDSLCLFLRHNCVPSPYSIYRGIRKLPPGHFLELRATTANANDWPVSQPYWSLADAIDAGGKHPFKGDESEAIAELDALLANAVSRQMVADVPLGAFLSGGIDSSAIVALMQRQSARPIRTFTIGFTEDAYNEAIHAEVVARHLGTEHTQLYVSPQQALDVIPRLPTLYDEPFADSSQIPTFLVSELARKHVTVSLSGDGGDELFGGYNRYFLTDQWWKRIRTIPPPVRRSLSSLLTWPTPAAWGRLGSGLARVSGNRELWLNLASRVPKLASALRSEDGVPLYMQFISHWPDPADLVIGGSEPRTRSIHPTVSDQHIVAQMMSMDTLGYLPDDILVKVDRAAMGVSLETRVPFLDHRVVEFAWRLPHTMKVRNGQGKWILRQVLHQYVPEKLINRPKMGFGVPIDTWLRGPLREWAEDLLAESRLRRDGFFHPEPIRRKWVEHLSGRCDWHYLLWDVLMFQTWADFWQANRANDAAAD